MYFSVIILKYFFEAQILNIHDLTGDSVDGGGGSVMEQYFQ